VCLGPLVAACRAARLEFGVGLPGGLGLSRGRLLPLQSGGVGHLELCAVGGEDLREVLDLAGEFLVPGLAGGLALV
jgi:hypothetical protein